MQQDTWFRAVRWTGGARDGALELLDQRLLPGQETWLTCRTAADVAAAIHTMAVRGAPAIGWTAAYGAVLAYRDTHPGTAERASQWGLLHDARPTAVNLHWALRRMAAVAQDCGLDGDELIERLLAEAHAIGEEDLAANLAMGALGAELMPERARILTHCNTGSLATAGVGTALGVIRATAKAGKLEHVYADETRPYLQGARLTVWELMRDSLPVSLVTDGMPGYLMQQGLVHAVIVGADRIAANGDTANKIGTYGLAVLAHHHGIPFYVAAPTSTVDLNTASGRQIPIEQRSAAEVTELAGVAIAPAGARAEHPAFDVTPGELITGIITERGVALGSYTVRLRELMNQP